LFKTISIDDIVSLQMSISRISGQCSLSEGTPLLLEAIAKLNNSKPRWEALGICSPAI